MQVESDQAVQRFQLTEKPEGQQEEGEALEE